MYGSVAGQRAGRHHGHSGTVHDEQEKQQLWDEYQRLDPDMRSGDLVLNVQVDGGLVEEYVVKPGDTLSKIAAHHGSVTWTQIYEANRDRIRDPNTIYPGQKLRIPAAKA